MFISRSVILFGAMLVAAGSARADSITNPNFAPATTVASPGYGPVTGWTTATQTSFNGSYLSGSNTSSDPFFDNGASSLPSGVTTVGFVQVVGSTTENYFSQLLSLTPGLTYTLSYYEDARAEGYGSPLVTVFIGGTTVIAQHTDVAGSFRLQTANFTATSSSELLKFDVMQGSGRQDSTALFADVSVVPTVVPEPASILLLGTGVLGMVAAARRKLIQHG